MKFRPCIDIHNGKVKQIVGGSLKDEGDMAQTNFTSEQDAAWYADQVVKGFNDQVAMQDFSYGTAEEDSFGGYFQDRELHLKIYEESQYEADGEPMYETTVPADAYVTFDIQ